jgi:hypothetical protein
VWVVPTLLPRADQPPFPIPAQPATSPASWSARPVGSWAAQLPPARVAALTAPSTWFPSPNGHRDRLLAATSTQRNDEVKLWLATGVARVGYHGSGGRCAR